MDYTPGIVSLAGRGGTPIPSTLARQLALFVLLYSPLQMAADLPENYEKSPLALQFIKQVPADWEHTRVLAGEVGELAVIARRDRNSEDWYLGAGTDEEARSVDVPLSFLSPRIRYEATIYADAPDTRFDRPTRGRMIVTTRTVASTDRLTLALAPGGGTAIRFRAL
jgi:alpha-glucosidase